MQARPARSSAAGLLSFSVLLFAASAATAIAAHAQAPHVYTLRSDRLTANFLVAYGSLRTIVIEDSASHAKLQPDEAFTLEFRNGDELAASQFKLADAPVEQPLSGNPSAPRQADRASGTELCADLSAQDKPLTVHWCAILHDHANYLRQEVTLRAAAQPVDISEVRLFDFQAPGAEVIGKVPGSPIVADNFFFGFESPLSASKVVSGNVTSLLARVLPLGANQSITYSSVIGVAAPGQMRREFLAYLEQERAHPYRTFLHYNTWYDLGLGERFDEAQALDRIHAFGEELVRKRGVTMDSLLFDDGWDDTQSLWGFNPGLPNGFSKIRDTAAQYGFGIGVWLSPWGGYAAAKKQRMIAGEKAGYETVKGGFALSAPKYYQLFESTCLNMITQYGVNQFKFDGTGNASQVFPGSLFDSDSSAAIHLIERLRQQDPNIFINLTTGTRPSPFWLRYADTIWRGGDDNSFVGVGTWRQKWITYRDEQTYRNIVLGGPLYPLSSLMLHGLLYANKGLHLSDDPSNDFPDEVHTYFGSGTELQEMYITPSLLSTQDWDVLAESARWSRSNAKVLKDTHWIGGDPGKLEVYGWASWTPAKGIVVLRNPSDRAKDFALDVDKAFELPSSAPQRYVAQSPWSADTASTPLQLRAGQPQTIHLKPFQVLILDVAPQN